MRGLTLPGLIQSRVTDLSLRAVAAAGGRRAERLDDDLRLCLVGVIAVGALVAALHHVLLGAVLSGGSWWEQTATGLLSFPHPVVQPLLAGLGASGVVLIGLMTAGFTAARPGHVKALIGLSGTTTLGGLPAVLFGIAFVAFWLLFIVLVLAIGGLVATVFLAGS